MRMGCLVQWWQKVCVLQICTGPSIYIWCIYMGLLCCDYMPSSWSISGQTENETKENNCHVFWWWIMYRGDTQVIILVVYRATETLLMLWFQVELSVTTSPLAARYIWGFYFHYKCTLGIRKPEDRSLGESDLEYFQSVWLSKWRYMKHYNCGHSWRILDEPTAKPWKHSNTEH